MMSRQAQGYKDAHKFDPERFNEERKEDISCNKHFLTFGLGPHGCVGREYAINHLVAFLAILSTSAGAQRCVSLPCSASAAGVRLAGCMHMHMDCPVSLDVGAAAADYFTICVITSFATVATPNGLPLYCCIVSLQIGLGGARRNPTTGCTCRQCTRQTPSSPCTAERESPPPDHSGLVVGYRWETVGMPL